MINKIKMLSKLIEEEVIDLRRRIHQNPELRFEEKDTAQLIKDYLIKNNIKLYSNYADTTAVIGEIGNRDSGPTIALRADMDGLPISETSGLPFASKIPGKMHACGHDAHVAILLGAINLLSRMKDKIKGRIIFVFQPAEEGCGGAESLLQKGLIEDFNITMFFGHHVWPGLPAGTYGLKAGVLTSISDIIKVDIDGKSAHGSMPQQGKDPIVIASHLILNIQDLISREISPYEAAVLSICKIESGTTHNIIPSKAQLLGTMRCFSEKTHKYMLRRLNQIVTGTADTFDSNAKIFVKNIANPVFNNHELTLRVTKAARKYWGHDKTINLENPLMVGEDFSCFSEKVPSFFGLFGIGGLNGLHSSSFIFDESIIDKAVGWTVYLALKGLEFAFAKD
ncbi:MAG TPA: M20 family metallopeptidase [Atribacterota bacterium]|nr:M20 family metallopeptidase [Atribacterota bacterium]